MVDDFRESSKDARDAFAGRIAADRQQIFTDNAYALDAIVGERRRIARELHDRVGSGLSVAHRQLELLRAGEEQAPASLARRAEKAHRAVLESMDSLRAVLSDLRLDVPFDSLEEALASHLGAVGAADVMVRLRVTGDEAPVPPAVRAESFLIVREAIRNAVGHGAPGKVLIGVHIAPHELRAIVEDTGRGFDQATTLAAGTVGLSSMRERAAILGGSLSVVSRPGRGTRVELIVPLPPRRPDHAYGFEPALP